MRYTIISMLALAIAAAAAYGQGAASSNLVDSFGRINCGDAQARTDNFISELWNNPMAGGVINVSPDAEDPVPAFVLLQEITSQLRVRRFDESRINILIGPPRSETSIQFVRELPGDSSRLPEPNLPPAEYDRTPPRRPLKFGSSILEEGPVCGSSAYDPNVFALAVNQIPTVKARVVVRARNAASAKKIRAEIRETLEKRMRSGTITYVNMMSRNEGVELWLDPVKEGAAVSKGKPSEDFIRMSALRDVESYSGDIQKYPDDPDAYIMRARAFVKLDRTGEAIEDLTKAIGLSDHPFYVAQATIDRGEVYLKRGDHAKSDADFSAVIVLAGAEPYRPAAYLNRARSRNAEGKRAEALADASEAIALYSARERTGAKKRLGGAFALRSLINCSAGKTKAAAADTLKAKTFGTPAKPCRPKYGSE